MYEEQGGACGEGYELVVKKVLGASCECVSPVCADGNKAEGAREVRTEAERAFGKQEEPEDAPLQLRHHFRLPEQLIPTDTPPRRDDEASGARYAMSSLAPRRRRIQSTQGARASRFRLDILDVLLSLVSRSFHG